MNTPSGIRVTSFNLFATVQFGDNGVYNNLISTVFSKKEENSQESRDHGNNSQLFA